MLRRPRVPALLTGARAAQQRVLVADARVIDLTQPAEAEKFRKHQQAWQPRAWEHYEAIPEIWFPVNYIANALTRVKLYPARRENAAAVPVPLNESDDGQLFADATDAIDRLMLPIDGQTPLLADMGHNLSVPGECYLVGRDARANPGEGDAPPRPGATGSDRWGVYSPEQVRPKPGTVDVWELVEEPGGEKITLDPDSSYVARIWQPYRRWRGLADSMMRPLDFVCQELLTLTQGIRGALLSRLNAGILLMPNEFTFTRPDATKDNAGDGEARDDDFFEDLMAALVTPISDPGSAASVVPNLVRGPAEFMEKVRLLELSRTLDPQTQALRKELIERAANGIDLPREVTLGLSTSPFSRAAWQIDQQTWKAHVEPKVITLAAGTTTGYLRPWLEGLGYPPDAVNDVVVWFDPADLIGKPDEAEHVKWAYPHGLVTRDRTLKALGFDPDEDLPEGDELEEIIRIEGELRASPGGFGDGEPDSGAEGDVAEAAAVGAAVGARAAVEHPAAIVASAKADGSAPVSRLGGRLARIDRELLSRLRSDADALLFRALERAGATARRRLSRSDLGELREVPNHRLLSELGRARSRGLGIADQGLLEGAFDPLRVKWDTLVGRAQTNVANIAEAAGADFDPDARQVQADEDSTAGWLVLAAGLGALAQARVFDPDPAAPALGEFDPTVRVPAGIVRGALARAGGATGRVTPGGAVLLDTLEGVRPVGGIATGVTALDLFRAANIITTGYTWVHGDPVTPFEPHADLDGEDFDGWEDEKLAITTDWPPAAAEVGFYFPGDHDTCTCTYEPAMSSVESEAA